MTAPRPASDTPQPEPPPTDRQRAGADRLPEIVAAVGASLVALAVGGFLSAHWDALDGVRKAMVLGAAATGLTAAGLWADRSRRRVFELVVGMAWATATLLVTAAVTLATATALPGHGRVTIALGGVAGAVHAAVLWRRRPESLLQQVSLFGALVFAAGPFGSGRSDVLDWGDAVALADPFVGLVDPLFHSDAFLFTGVAHLVIGIVWLALSHALAGPRSRLATIVGTVTVGFAALELNVLTNPVGAVAALAVVLGYLIYGLARDEAGLLVTGAIGALVAGVRVLAALLSGQVLVTVLVFTGGLAMLAWAFRQVRRRQTEVRG